MKKKAYYIIYSIVQFVACIFSFCTAASFAKNQIESISEVLPAGSDKILQFLSVESLTSSTRLLAVVGAILAIVFLVLAISEKVEKKKSFSIALCIAVILISNYSICSLLAIVTLILVANSKEKSEKKEKKKLEKLETLKTTKKDYILSVVLVLCYSLQFFVPIFLKSAVGAIIFEIIFRIGLVVLVFLAFNKKIKRDFIELKKNFSLYVGFGLKCWVIMIGLSILAVIIKMILGVNIISENQVSINEAAPLYIVPLAILWAPIVEEGIFRGVVRRFVKNDVLFIIVSGVLFGLIHTIFSEIGLMNILVQSLQYVIMGGVFAYAYLKTNNIWTSIMIHFFQNSIAMLLLLFTAFVL